MKPNVLITAILIAAATLWAQAPGPDPQGQASGDEGPGRGVARVSLLNGDVSMRRGDSGEVVAAALNAPLMSGDALMTGNSARAEVQLDSANFIRLAPNTEVRFSQVDNGQYQAQLAIGTVTFTMLRDSNANVEISTPAVSVRPQKSGAYRILVREDGTAEITVRAGEADVFTPRGSERLESGHTMLVRGSASDPEFQIVDARAMDQWDQWNANRDRELQRADAETARYVDRSIYGAQDLSSYGRWVYDPAYGWVWVPRVEPDWAPYRDGRWAWEDYYGWTWVGNEPWGWAPYHWGRWYFRTGWGWSWYPGAFGRPYYWRPALVAFFGWGGYGGFHAGIGFGYPFVGWVPLAPHEVYHPWYGRGWYGRNAMLANRTTIIGNTNLANMYRNARFNNGVTGIRATEFGRGRIGNANLVRVNQGEIERANLVRGELPLTPGRESLRVSDRNAQANSFGRGFSNTRFFSTRPATQVERVPFDQQRQQVERTARSTFGAEGVNRGSLGQTGQTGRFAGGAASSAGAQRGGWRRIDQGGAGSPGATNAAPAVRGSGPAAQSAGRTGTMQANPSRGEMGGGWRRFSGPSSQPDGTAGYSRQASPGTMNAPRGAAPRLQGRPSAPNSNWRGFESNPSNRGGRTYSSPQRSDPQVQRQSPSQSYRQAPDNYNRGSVNARPSDRGGFNRSEPVRINPPIVRERPSSGGFRSGGGGGNVRSGGGGGARPSGGPRGGGGGRRH